jgi:hypothetical protein
MMRDKSRWEKLPEPFEKLKTKIRKGFSLCGVLDQRLFNRWVEKRKRLEEIARKSGYEAGYYDGYVEVWWGYSWDPPYSDGLPWSVGYTIGYKRGFDDSANRRIHRFDGTDYYHTKAKTNGQEKGQRETEEKKLEVGGKDFGEDYETGFLDVFQGAPHPVFEDERSARRAVRLDAYQLDNRASTNREPPLYGKRSYETKPEIRQIRGEAILSKSLPQMFEEWTRRNP